MATDTHLEDCIVLKKTKLGEADLIVTFLTERGESTQGVARGARKPQSALSSYLELGNVVHVLFARGKKLDIVTETRLVKAHPRLGTDPARFAAASSIIEFVAKTSEENLEQPRLFAMTRAALDLCETMEIPDLPYLVAAYILKATSFSGLRPSLRLCAGCGRSMDQDGGSYRAFSFMEGGVVCDGCSLETEHRSIAAPVISLADILIASPFSAISELPGREGRARAVLDFSREWVITHLGTRIRSLDLLESYC